MIVWNHFHREYLGPGNISRHFYDILKAFLRWAIFHGLCSLILCSARITHFTKCPETQVFVPEPRSCKRSDKPFKNRLGKNMES